MTEPFGNSGEVFKYSLFLVLINRIVTFSTSILALLVRSTPLQPHLQFALKPDRNCEILPLD